MDDIDPKDVDGLTAFDREVNPKRTLCSGCGRIARGYAFIDGKRFCHPDDGPSCYVAQPGTVVARLSGDGDGGITAFVLSNTKNEPLTREAFDRAAADGAADA